MIIISNTNVETYECIFINFLQHFFQILLIFAYIRLLNVNRSGTGVENIFACPHKKNHLKLGQGFQMATRM